MIPRILMVFLNGLRWQVSLSASIMVPCRFTGARDDTIPEYLFSRAASVEEGAEIWEITSTGTERLTAVFDGKG